MIHEILPVGPLQCNCSIFGDEQSREGLVVDPGDDIDQVLAIIRRHQLKGTDRPSEPPRGARGRELAVCLARRTGGGP